MQPTPTTPHEEEEEGYRFLLPERTGELIEFLHSRCRVEITPYEIRVREQLGPLHWTRSFAWDPQSKFSVAHVGEPSGPLSSSAIRMESTAQSRMFALGYAEDKLTQLVEHLRAAQLEWAPRHALAEGDASSPAPSGKASDIRVRRTPSGLHAEIPPLGLVQGSKGLWVMGLVFCTFSIGAGSFVTLTAGDSMRGADLGFIGMALSFFTLIGVAMATIGWNMAKRRATIDIDDDWLLVKRTSILGESAKQIPRISISKIALGPSGIVVNGAPLNELQIFSRGRKVLGMMSQRSDADIERLALALMDALTSDDDEGPSSTSE